MKRIVPCLYLITLAACLSPTNDSDSQPIPALTQPISQTNILPPSSDTNVLSEINTSDSIQTKPAQSSLEQPDSYATPEPLPPIDWRTMPILPDINPRILEIYRDGQAQGRNPHHFSVIGDCQAIPFVFMGPYERGELSPMHGYMHVWDSIGYFKGSFIRTGAAVRGGFTAASILSPIQADPLQCKPGETPLTCEYRLHNPAFVFITLETWLEPATIDRYESYLRRILDYVISRGTVPILLTKADSSELGDGTHIINPVIVQIAREYNVPLVNFWHAAQYLDNYGIDAEREGFHLSPEAYDLKNQLALITLDAARRAVLDDSVMDNSDDPIIEELTDPASITSGQLDVKINRPDCEMGCIYFGLVASHDGEIQAQGVYAYEVERKVLIQVLEVGFDLQDVSGDGLRLLANRSNHLYEINLGDQSSELISETFNALGRQGAYWDVADQEIVHLDISASFSPELDSVFNLIPSPGVEHYVENGVCLSKDYCQLENTFRVGNGSAEILPGYIKVLLSPNGDHMAFLDGVSLNSSSYHHTSKLLLEKTEQGILSRRIFYFPHVKGFMVYPDVREYAFSPGGDKLFVLYDAYSEYYEKSLRLQGYSIDIKTGALKDHGAIQGAYGSLNPRLVWSPQGDAVVFLLTDISPDFRYKLSLYQTHPDAGGDFLPITENIFSSEDYFYVTNLYWRTTPDS